MSSTSEELWYKPGSKRIDYGYVVWGPLVKSLHRSSLCNQVWTDDVSTVDVFEHPAVGQYIVHPRTGERRKAPKVCGTCLKPRSETCTIEGCDMPTRMKNLCRSHYDEATGITARRRARRAMSRQTSGTPSR